MSFLRKKNWILEWYSYLLYENIQHIRSHDWNYIKNESGVRVYECSGCNLKAHFQIVTKNTMDGREVVFSKKVHKISYLKNNNTVQLTKC